MNDRWMTVKDLAEYLQLSTDQIYRLAQQGKIPASRVGTRWRFKKARIDDWMDGNETNGPESDTQSASPLPGQLNKE
jgi:excisionase family DNA binding protein